MVLQTDKLLPFLQTQFSQQEASQPYKSQGFESDHLKDAAAAAANGGAEASSVKPPDSFHASTGTSDTQEASETEPLLGGADSSKENGSKSSKENASSGGEAESGTPVPRKHAKKAIKGEWQFKMYTDVLHAQVLTEHAHASRSPPRACLPATRLPADLQ